MQLCFKIIQQHGLIGIRLHVDKIDNNNPGKIAQLDLPGNYVLMKSASHMAEVKQMIAASGKKAMAVENCSMENEKVYRTLEEIPDSAGYFSLVIVKPE